MQISLSRCVPPTCLSKAPSAIASQTIFDTIPAFTVLYRRMLNVTPPPGNHAQVMKSRIRYSSPGDRHRSLRHVISLTRPREAETALPSASRFAPVTRASKKAGRVPDVLTAALGLPVQGLRLNPRQFCADLMEMKEVREERKDGVVERVRVQLAGEAGATVVTIGVDGG